MTWVIDMWCDVLMCDMAHEYRHIHIHTQTYRFGTVVHSSCCVATNESICIYIFMYIYMYIRIRTDTYRVANNCCVPLCQIYVCVCLCCVHLCQIYVCICCRVSLCQIYMCVYICCVPLYQMRFWRRNSSCVLCQICMCVCMCMCRSIYIY